MRKPTTKFVGEPGARIACASFGRGPAVLLLPHWASNIEGIWTDPGFTRFAAKLASMAEVIHFDKRGVGLSDDLPGDRLPDLDTATADVITVLDATGHDRVVVVAADLAGPLGLRFAAQHPGRIEALALIAATARVRRGADYRIGLGADTIRRARAGIEDAWVHPGPDSVQGQEPSLAEDAAYIRTAAAYRRSTASPARAAAIFSQLVAWDVRVDATCVTCPTTVVHRRDDRYIPISHGRYLVDLIPGAQFVELSGADHTPWSGDQDEVLEVIAGVVLADRRARGVHPARRRGRHGPRFGWHALTDAERAVVDLLVQGFTNKEAAATLGVTARTVETQLQSAYAKLGINTRAELAREAMRQEQTVHRRHD